VYDLKGVHNCKTDFKYFLVLTEYSVTLL